MNLLTIDTLTALAGVHRRLPEVLVRLLSGHLTADESDEVSDLLVEAAELLCEHTADQARGIVQLPAAPETDADQVLASVTALSSRS